MGRDKTQEFEEQIARPIARSKWRPDPDATSATSVTLTSTEVLDLKEPKDLQSILATLASSEVLQLQGLQSLNGALRDGGHDAAEDACRLGAIRISIDLLKSKRPEVLEKSVEALWLLVDDHDSCQELIQRKGHQEIWQILRRDSLDDQLASNVFRLMAETLYGESRSSSFWKDGLDGHFLSEALDWSIQAALSGSGDSLGFVCDVAALWLQRCPGKLEAVKALLENVPALLQALALCPNDALQHGCRFLWAMAEVTSKTPGHAQGWPESLGQPTLKALEEMKHMDLPPQVMHYHAMALLMVKRMTTTGAKSSVSLDSMD